jgi:hypothetical protein
LFLLNAAVAAVAAGAVFTIAVNWAPVMLLVLAVVGPFAAALMHCAVTLQQTDRLRLGDGVAGLRLHWRRGLALGVVAAAAVVLAVTSVSFWSHRGALAWPLTIAAAYLAALFAVWQIHLWPLAVARRGTSLGDVAREAGVALARRPVASCVLALALLLVNAVGAIGVLPVLTITLAFSALAAAHFALPPRPEEATT